MITRQLIVRNVLLVVAFLLLELAHRSTGPLFYTLNILACIFALVMLFLCIVTIARIRTEREVEIKRRSPAARFVALIYIALIIVALSYLRH